MDAELMRLMHGGKGGKDVVLEILDVAAGTVELKGAGGKVRHTIKPLKELYVAKGEPAEMDPTSAEYMPLFMGIEGEILAVWEEMPELTDGQVLLGLEKLAMSPEREVAGDLLMMHVQWALRLQLSLGDYSRKEVQRALRKIGQSVARHTREGGQRGYLMFIREFMP